MTVEKHFVTFLSPGTFVHEQSEKPIHAWDVAVATEMARDIHERHDATPFAFRFSTRRREDDQLDSQVAERSGFYYLGGEVLTLADVKARNDPKDRTLIANMECNGIGRVVVNTNSWRVTQPLEDGDTVLDFAPCPEKEKGVQR